MDRGKEGEQAVFKQREEATDMKLVNARRYQTRRNLL